MKLSQVIAEIEKGLESQQKFSREALSEDVVRQEIRDVFTRYNLKFSYEIAGSLINLFYQVVHSPPNEGKG